MKNNINFNFKSTEPYVFPVKDVLAVYFGRFLGTELPQELVGHLIGDHSIMTLGCIAVINSHKLNPYLESKMPILATLQDFKNVEDVDSWIQNIVSTTEPYNVSLDFGAVPLTPDDVRDF